MKLGGTQYLEDLDPERFIYLKSVFAIKKAVIMDILDTNRQMFMGNFEGISVYSNSFEKGKYTL